jgi:hypothetical protein
VRVGPQVEEGSKRQAKARCWQAGEALSKEAVVEDALAR